MTYEDAHRTWTECYKPAVIACYGEDDYPALSESWNDYTDGLCKDGELTDLQYHHCPAWDDIIPDAGGEVEYMLDAMGVAFDYERVRHRPDNFMDGDGMSHWRVTLTREGRSMVTYYSMGPALKGPPDLPDVLNCLLMDTSDIEAGYDFEEWAENLGLNPDSRKDEGMFRECEETLADLQKLFSQTELDGLRELFADY